MRRSEPVASELWRFAERHLHDLRTPYGLAASNGLYNALFGRDSLWTLRFVSEAVRLCPLPSAVAWAVALAGDILTHLSRLQGTTTDDAIEEQPGKIVHEFHTSVPERVERMKIPFKDGRSYNGFDQTFLFISTFRCCQEVFPSNAVLELIWPNVVRALEWIDCYADSDGDGLYEYRRRDPRNAINQVWKDSFDSVVENGLDLPIHPLAWIEVQGYAYRAFKDAEHLYTLRGQKEAALGFASKADAIRRKVDEQFWAVGENCFWMALDGNKSPVHMVSSNAAHAFWAGLVEPVRERGLIQRLMQRDMMSRYGLRTLSSASPFYAPFTYHRGNVWPFDNGVFVMALFENDYWSEARDIITRVSEAITQLGSPVEAYVVLEKDLFSASAQVTDDMIAIPTPIRENRNQAWTSATLLYMAAVLAIITGTDLTHG